MRITSKHNNVIIIELVVVLMIGMVEKGTIVSNEVSSENLSHEKELVLERAGQRTSSNSL